MKNNDQVLVALTKLTATSSSVLVAPVYSPLKARIHTKQQWAWKKDCLTWSHPACMRMASILCWWLHHAIMMQGAMQSCPTPE